MSEHKYQTKVSIILKTSNACCSLLQPGSCQSVHLHFLPFRERFNPIELVQLFDYDTGAVTTLRDVLEVYVHPRE